MPRSKGRSSVAEQSNNPQHRQMADESMVRNLAHQAEAIWPQESAIFRGYGLPDVARARCAAFAGRVAFREADAFAHQALELFEDMIACIRNPNGYAVWRVPILSARKRKSPPVTEIAVAPRRDRR